MQWNCDVLKLKSRIILILITFFVLIEINLVLLDFVFNHLKLIDFKPIRQLFNMELEGSLANWVSSIVYLSVGISLWLVTFQSKYILKQKFKSIIWSLIALFFTYLSVDDGASIHERVGTTLKLFYDKYEWNPKHKLLHYVINEFPSYYWQVIFIPILAISSIFILLFLWKELKSFKIFLFVGFAFFIMAFAQALDYLEGIRYTYPLIENNFNFNPKTIRHYSKVFEEFLEMFGMTILMSVFTNHFLSGISSLQLTLKKDT